MGLLDGFMPQQNPYGANDDQQKAALLTGLLSAGFGALTGRRGAPLNAVGRAGLLGLGGYSGAVDAATNQNMRMAQLEEQKQTGLLSRQNMEAQMAERAAKLARERGVQETIAGLQPPRTMLAGPMPDGMTMPPVQGQISPDMIAAALLQKGYADEAGKFAELGNKLAPKQHVLDGKVYEQRDGQLVELGGPGKPIDYNKPFLPDGRPNPDYQKYELAKAAAGKTQVSNTILPPQKTFENEQKMRDDFVKESAPFKEVANAYSIIDTALKNPSPANDLAAATKFMKILDPGSVVRESELGMAMSASGLFDRVQNYASMVANGQKLTPKQREDFHASAKALYESAGEQQKNITKGYQDRAGSYGLDASRIVSDYGVKDKPQRRESDKTPVRKFNPATGRIE